MRFFINHTHGAAPTKYGEHRTDRTNVLAPITPREKNFRKEHEQHERDLEAEARAHSGLAATNRLDFVEELLFTKLALQTMLRPFVKGLARARKKSAELRRGIVQAFLLDGELRTLDTVEPKVFFTST